MKVVNYTETRLNLKHWLDSVVDDVEEVIIRKRDQKDLVLISFEVYNSLIVTNYLLSGMNRKVLLESIAEVKKGKKELMEEGNQLGLVELGMIICVVRKQIEKLEYIKAVIKEIIRNPFDGFWISRTIKTRFSWFLVKKKRQRTSIGLELLRRIISGGRSISIFKWSNLNRCNKLHK